MTKDCLASTIVSLDSELRARAREIAKVGKQTNIPEAIRQKIQSFANRLESLCFFEPSEINANRVDEELSENDFSKYIEWSNSLFLFHAQISELEEQGFLPEDLEEEEMIEMETDLEQMLEPIFEDIWQKTQTWVLICLDLAQSKKQSETEELYSVSAAPTEEFESGPDTQNIIPSQNEKEAPDPKAEWNKQVRSLLGQLEKGITTLNTFESSLPQALADYLRDATDQVSKLKLEMQTSVLSIRVRQLTEAQIESLRVICETFNYGLYVFINEFTRLLKDNESQTSDVFEKNAVDLINQVVETSRNMVFNFNATAFATHIPPRRYKKGL